MAVRTDAASDYLLRSANLPSSTAFTVCGWAVMDVDKNTATTLATLENALTAATSGYYLTTGATGTELIVYSTALGGSATLISMAVGTPFFWAMSANGAGAGLLKASARTASENSLTSVTNTSGSFTSAALYIGNEGYGLVKPFDGRHWNVKCWDRELTDAELLVESFFDRVMYPSSLNFHWPLHDVNDTADRSGNGRDATVGGTLTSGDSISNLWKPSPKFWEAASGTVNYSLTCDAGSYAIAGQDVALRRGYQLTCEAGSYVLSGQDANLIVAHQLTCDAGAYTLAGQDATLTYTAGAANYTLTCDAGAYAISGQDATLTYVAGAANYSLTCDAGAYVIAGQDATLNYVPGAGTVNYTLTCDAGAYTIAGQDANLIVAHTLVCDAGAYVIAGQDATLTYVAGAANYSLTCDAGAYVLSGQDATLRRGYQLTCEAGAYTLSGQDATLTYVDGATPINYTLTCEAGAYVISGQDATFAFSGATTPRRHASAWKKRYYLIKGQKYLLDDRELAVKISEMLADISTVQRISKGKKKQLSPQYWAAIEALITEKVFYVEDNEDDEEILLMF